MLFLLHCFCCFPLFPKYVFIGFYSYKLFSSPVSCLVLLLYCDYTVYFFSLLSLFVDNLVLVI